MSEVLIAGCGYVGTALGEVLTRDNHKVWALRRDPEGLPSALLPLACDLTSIQSVETLPTSFEYAIFCASPGRASEDAYRQTYVRGLSNLLQHLEQCPQMRQVFFISSTSVYHQEDGSWLNENSPTLPNHYPGQRTLEAELLLNRSHLPSTALRCGGIYGPTRTRLVSAVRDGSIELPSRDRFTNRIHRDDIAGAIAYLMRTLPTPLPERLLLVDDDPALYSEVLCHLADQLGCPRPQTSSEAPASRRGGNKRCSNAQLKQLGYQLLYPSFREGYAPLLETGIL